MSTPIITENSMYKDAAGRAAIVANPKLAAELFFVNFLGFIGLYALNDSRGYMKTHEASEKKLRINEIADDNHDSSLAVKLCVDAGVLPEAKAYSVTRLLNLIKTRAVRAKDIDDVKIRELVNATQLASKPMSATVSTVVDSFMSSKIGVKEFSRQIYDVSKKTEWRDYSLEFRTIVLKGQYTDYFTVMKRDAANGTAPAKPVLPPAYLPPAATPAAIPAATPAAIPMKPSFDASKVWVDSRGKLDDMLKMVDIYIANGVKLDEVIASIEAAPLATIGHWPLKDVDKLDTKKGGHTRIRLAAFRRSLDACLQQKNWNGMTVLDVGYVHDNGALLKSFLAVASKLDAGWVASNKDKWEVLARLTSKAGADSGHDIATAANALISIDVPNHNAFLYSIWWRADSAVDVKNASQEAIDWVKKNGMDANMAPHRFTFVITPSKAEWLALTTSDRLAWVLDNWTPAAVAKLAAIMGPLDAVLFDKISWQGAKNVIARTGMPNWQAQAFWSRLAHNDHRPAVNTYSAAAALCALVTLRNKGTLDGKFVNRSIIELLDTSWQDLPVFEDGFDDICDNVELDAVGSIYNFQAAMTTLFPTRNLGGRLPIPWRNVDVQSSNINKSRVYLLPFMPLSGISSDVVTDSGTELRISVDASPEVVAWVKRYGTTFAPMLTNGIARPKGITPAAIYMKGMMSEKGVGGTITSAEDEKMKAMTADEWAVVAKEVGDEAIKSDANFMAEWKMGGKVVFDHPYNNATYELAHTAARQYFINNHPLVVLGRGGAWPSSIVKVSVRAPMNKDKLALLVAITGQYDAYNTSYEGPVAIELLQSILKDVTDLSASQYVLAGLLVSAMKFDVIGTMDVVKTAIALNNQTLRVPYLFLLSTASLVDFEAVNAADLFPLIRWAWGFTGEELVAAINAGSTYKHVSSSMNRIDHSQLQGNGTIDVEHWPALRPKVGGVEVYDKVSMPLSARQLPVYAWGAKYLNQINLSPEMLPNVRDLQRLVNRLDASDPESAEILAVYAKRIIPHIATLVSTSNMTAVIWLASAMVTAGGDAKVVGEKLNAALKNDMTSSKRNIVDVAQSVQLVTSANLVHLIDKDTMSILVNKLAKSTSKAALASVPLLAFGDNKSTVLSQSFVEAVRAARVERAVINRLLSVNAVQQALAVVNADPNGVKLDLSGDRINTFLKFNDIDVASMSAGAVTKLEDLASARTAIAAIVPPLAMADISTPQVIKDRTTLLHRNNRYNHGKQLGMEVSRVFAVDIKGQRDRFDAWVTKNPTTKIMTLYHGTGTINAAFILRFGFKIIKSTDSSVTGRMLGDGIYFADNINKSMLYMSNAGYVRDAGQEGYVMKCKVALGQRPKDNREGIKEQRNLVSNEWSIFNLDQIVIEEAYYGFSRWKDDVKKIIGENAYRPMESCFMFMDGRVPVTETDTVDFEAIESMGDHITIERTAKGPIVNIRHDASVKPMDRCYRWGEEMHASDNKKDLKIFLKLLANTY